MTKEILILDTETTGLDPTKDRVIEVAAIRYSVQHATVLEVYSSLVEWNDNPAEAINRIPARALPNAAEPSAVWDMIRSLLWWEAMPIVAHNAEFDRSFCPPGLRKRQWVCTKTDVRWPKQTRPESSLVALALEHDLGVAYAHRALADCDLIARLFTRAHELGCDLQELLARAMRPKRKYEALVSFDDRELAKRAGFRWESDALRWTRSMPAEDAEALGFRVREVTT